MSIMMNFVAVTSYNLSHLHISSVVAVNSYASEYFLFRKNIFPANITGYYILIDRTAFFIRCYFRSSPPEVFLEKG